MVKKDQQCLEERHLRGRRGEGKYPNIPLFKAKKNGFHQRHCSSIRLRKREIREDG